MRINKTRERPKTEIHKEYFEIKRERRVRMYRKVKLTRILWAL